MWLFLLLTVVYYALITFQPKSNPRKPLRRIVRVPWKSKQIVKPKSENKDQLADTVWNKRIRSTLSLAVQQFVSSDNDFIQSLLSRVPAVPLDLNEFINDLLMDGMFLKSDVQNMKQGVQTGLLSNKLRSASFSRSTARPTLIEHVVLNDVLGLIRATIHSYLTDDFIHQMTVDLCDVFIQESVSVKRIKFMIEKRASRLQQWTRSKQRILEEMRKHKNNPVQLAHLTTYLTKLDKRIAQLRGPLTHTVSLHHVLESHLSAFREYVENSGFTSLLLFHLSLSALSQIPSESESVTDYSMDDADLYSLLNRFFDGSCMVNKYASAATLSLFQEALAQIEQGEALSKVHKKEVLEGLHSVRMRVEGQLRHCLDGFLKSETGRRLFGDNARIAPEELEKTKVVAEYEFETFQEEEEAFQEEQDDEISGELKSIHDDAISIPVDLQTEALDMKSVEAQTELSEKDKIKQRIAILDQQAALVSHMVEAVSSKTDKQHKLLVRMLKEFTSERARLVTQHTRLTVQQNGFGIVAGRTRIRIDEWVMGMHHHSAKPFVLFLIKVDPCIDGLSSDMATGGWIVARRYSQFYKLSRVLKRAFPEKVRKDVYKLPAKRGFMQTLIKPVATRFLAPLSSFEIHSSSFGDAQGIDSKEREFMDSRRTALERYLRLVLQDPVLASSPAVVDFLTRDHFFQGEMAVSDLESKEEKTVAQSLKRSSMPNLSNSPKPSIMGTFKKWIPGFKQVTVEDGPSEETMTSRLTNKMRQIGSPALSLLDTITTKLSGAFHAADDVDSDDEGADEEEAVHSDSSIADADITATRKLLNNSELIQSQSDSIRHQISESISTPLMSSSRSRFSDSSSSKRVLQSFLTPDIPSNHVEVYSTVAAQAAARAKSKTLTKPIPNVTESLCDLFIDLFELNEKNNWLRKHAVLLILQQFLGGTIERKLAEFVKWLESDEMIHWIFDCIDDLIKYGTVRKSTDDATKPPPLPAPRTEEQKRQTKESAWLKLEFLIPDNLGPMVGKANAKRGAAKIFEILQNKEIRLRVVNRLLDQLERLFINSNQ